MPGMLRTLSRRFSKKNVAAQPAATEIPQETKVSVDEPALPPAPPLAADGETVHLKVLRGQGLIARDEVALGTSDAYCVVYVDGAHVGTTRVVARSLDPVWSDSDAEWDVRLTPKSRVKIYIQDFDSFLFGACALPDDPMGEVCFIAENACGDALNRWFEVTPTMGCECSGRLEVQLTRGPGAPPPPPAPKSFTAAALAMPLSAGPRVALTAKERVLGVTVERLLRRACAARAPVFLHVYDVGHSKAVGNINAVAETATGGGIFHGAIEVHGRELSFGGTRQDKCGIFACKPRACPMHTYKQSVYLGDCGLAREQVQTVLNAMKKDWWGPTYDLLRKNCCSFSREFAYELGVGELPDWIDRLAKWGTEVDNAKRGEIVEVRGAKLEAKVVEATFFEHVMASRLQAKFRNRKMRRALEEAALAASAQ